MINRIIPIIHLIVVIFYSFYPFIFPKKFIYDYLYYVSAIIFQLSWIFFNHECVFSYFYKKINYKNYNCGDTTTLDDFNELTGDNDIKKIKNSYEYGKLVDNIFLFFYILSVLITGYRSKLANMFSIIFVLIIVKYFYLFLNGAIGWNTEKILGKYYIYYDKFYNYYRINSIHYEINTLIAIINISFFIYITHINWKRF